MNNTPFMTEIEAASYLGLSSTTLARWRSIGTQGPAFYKFGGAVRYALADLVAYADDAQVKQ
jgi:hypothetical protein